MNEAQGAEQDLQQVEISIEQAKKKIVLGEALEKLKNNTYFKTLIEQEYLQDYAIKMVQNKASYGMQDNDNQQFIANEINAIGSFSQFLRFVAMEAYHAKQSMAADEVTREEILAEDV